MWKLWYKSFRHTPKEDEYEFDLSASAAGLIYKFSENFANHYRIN